jgi:ectoine hydroxylase-related dioxygenase (phytanoyl-CoA dioxygenase family)
MVSQQLIDEFQNQGFTIARGLFTEDECDHYLTYFTDMLERGGDGWAEGGVDFETTDPLRRYPRLLQPHRGDDVALGYMVDARLNEHLTAIAGQEPYAVQTMVYFKAPGSRGQNLHQDNLYLQAEPGTCLAAWTALEDCDEGNGCMTLVPGSHGLPMMCQVEMPELKDECWGTITTEVPPGMTTVNAIMKKGDTLFFNGSVIHGSYKNNSDRFRRTLIGHYIAGEAKQVANYYFPVFRMDGSRLDDGAIAEAIGGGPCGRYVETDKGLEIVMEGEFKKALAAH